jgi:hypothetical protein
MQDFVRPHGRYSTMPVEMKKALFSSAAKIINKTKIYSISVAIPNKDFKLMFPPEAYRYFTGGYALAFLAVVIANHEIAKTTRYNNRISYLIDKGSQHHHEQLEGAHAVMLKIEKESNEKFTGPMTSDLDDKNNALQAADVIAWTYHRSHESAEMGEDFTALLNIFQPHQGPSKKRPHIALGIPVEGGEGFANFIKNWIVSKGEIPSWPEVQRLAAQPK